MDENTRSLLVFIGGALLLAIIVVFGSHTFHAVFEKIGCSNYEKITGRQTKYVLCGGCFVRAEHGWLTKDEYGKVIIARDGLTGKDK